MEPLRYKVILKCGNTDYSSQVETLSYTDEADGASDAISVTLSNISGKWYGSKMPEKALKINAKIMKTGEGLVTPKIFNCGTFYLDDMEFQGKPSIAVFGAVSDPVSYAFKNRKRSKTWKNTNLKQVAEDVSKNYPGLKVIYDAPAIPIASLEQSKQTDSSFLDSLTEKYGCGLKIYSDKIIIYGIEQYENKKEVRTFTPKDMEPGWTYRTTIRRNYTGVKLTYKTSNGKKIEARAGTTKRLLCLSEKVDNQADAMRIALARVNRENADTTTLRFTLRTPIFLTATSCIAIKDMGQINGKYFITKVRHSLSSGYKVQVECRKITKRIEK